MKKTMHKVITAGILATSVLGFAGLAGAGPTPWGPFTPTTSQAETSSNVNGDSVTIQASIFNGAAFATVNGNNVGPYTNELQLNCSDGSEQAKLVNGTNNTNGNLSFYCPFFTTATEALGEITSN